MHKKFLLNPLTQAIIDAENAEKLKNAPAIDVMTCGGCGALAFYIFATGQVACASCHEVVAGVCAKPETVEVSDGQEVDQARGSLHNN